MYLYLFTSTVWKFICTVCSTVYALVNCKNEEDQIKNEGATVVTSFVLFDGDFT